MLSILSRVSRAAAAIGPCSPTCPIWRNYNRVAKQKNPKAVETSSTKIEQEQIINQLSDEIIRIRAVNCLLLQDLDDIVNGVKRMSKKEMRAIKSVYQDMM